MTQSRGEQRLPLHGSETLPRTMPQLLLPGMPEGAVRINPVVSRLSKDGQVTWFLGADNYFSHPADDTAGHRLALATLMSKRTRPSLSDPKNLGHRPALPGALAQTTRCSRSRIILPTSGRARRGRAQRRNIRAMPTPAQRGPLHRHDRPTCGHQRQHPAQSHRRRTDHRNPAPPAKPPRPPPPTSSSAVSSAACPPSAPTACSQASTAI